jgi:hypothetical protein
MDLSKLTDKQLEIAIKVAEAAERNGLNPDFVLPMVMIESKFNHSAVSPKGAIGVMQLMPDTAKSLKVDPNNLDQNIDGGIRLLKELVSNPKIGSDPYKVLAGYNASTETRNKFYESGDFADLKDETINHMIKVSELYGGDLPKVSGVVTEEAANKPSDEVTVANEENVYSGTPVTEFESGKTTSPMETGAMSGLYGAGAGAVYSAHAPALRLAQKIGLLPGNKPITPTDAAELVERTMTANAPEAKPLQGGEKWQKSLTGISTPGAQMGKSSLDLAKDMQSAVGVRGAPGFTGGTITEGGIILNPRDAAAVQAKQAAAAKPFVLPQPTQDAAQRVARGIMGSAPVKGGLAGLGVGYNVQDAYNKFDEGDMLGGTLATTGAGMSALGLVPKLAARANPAAIGFTTASQVAGDLRRGDKQSAAESGLTGGAALLPRIFGPLGALFYSGGLNKDEDKELQRRRAMNPTLSP